MVSIRCRLAVGVPLILLLVSAPAAAQPPVGDLELKSPSPPAPAPELGIEPTMPLEEQGAREQEFYPSYPVRSRHEPAFVQPFTATGPATRTSSVKVGLSGWTAPALPYDSVSTGGIAFGLTILWGVPRTDVKPPEPESPSQR